MRRFLATAGWHVRNFFTNWREYDAPVFTKLRLTVRNRFHATLSRQLVKKFRMCCLALAQNRRISLPRSCPPTRPWTRAATRGAARSSATA